MTPHASTDAPAIAARPRRPDLFAGRADENKSAPQHISVLASLDNTPPGPRPRAKGKLWLGLATLAGVGIAGLVAWQLGSSTPKPAGPSLVHQEAPATHAPAPAPLAAPSHTAASETEPAPQAPAIIEVIAQPVRMEAPEAPVASAQADADATPPSAENVATPAHEAEAEPRSLIRALSATPAKPVPASAASEAPKKARPAPAREARNPQRKAERERVDTDVILLEALVSHDPKRSKRAADDGGLQP